MNSPHTHTLCLVSQRSDPNTNKVQVGGAVLSPPTIFTQTLSTKFPLTPQLNTVWL